MNVTRLTGAVFVVLGLAMLALAILVPDAWFQANVNCGNTKHPRSPCQAGDAQDLLRPLGVGFAVGGVLLFGLARLMGTGTQRRSREPTCLAPAAVLSVEQPQLRLGSMSLSRGWCEVQLRVHPPDAAPFTARLRHSAATPLTPDALVTVSYPADRPGDVELVSGPTRQW